MATKIKKKFIEDVIFSDITTEISDAVEVEKARAEGVEAGLVNDIAAEQARAEAAEAYNATAIGVNAQAISDEVARAEAAEAALQASIDFITENTDPAAIDSLTEVVAAFESADGNLQTSITNLSTAAATDRALIRTEFANADDALESSLKGDAGVDYDTLGKLEDKIQEAEGGLQSQIDTINNIGISSVQGELDDTQAGAGLEADGSYSANASMSYVQAALSLKDADEKLDAGLAAEVVRAEAAEAGLQNAIDNEAFLRGEADSTVRSEFAAADTALHTTISAEIDADVLVEKNRAEAAEGSLQSQIDFITSNTDPAAIDSLTEVVAAFQSADSDLNNAITDLTSNAATDRALIRTEFANADDALQALIESNDADIATNAATIEAEQARAEGVEAGLAADIAGLQSDLDNLSGEGGFATDAELQSEVDSLTNADSALSARIQAFEQSEWTLQKRVIDQDDLDNGYVSFSIDKGYVFGGHPAFVFVDRLAAFEDEDFYFEVQPDGNTVHVVFTGLVDGQSSEQLAIGDEVRIKHMFRC